MPKNLISTKQKKSRYGEGSAFTTSNGDWDENMTYDLNGNIGSLFRKAAGLTVDSLEYDYTGNQLDYVDDSITSYSGDENHFKDGTPGTSIDYGYDDNGNMISDANKGIQSISYNHLNLPDLITFEGGNTIAYIYDAAGMKLSKVVTESGQPVKTTDYIGGIVYEDDTRKFINTEEGRIMLESTPEYQYHMKDHLGNVRLTFSTKEQVSTYMATMESAATTLEEATFDNISSTQHSNALYNHTSGGTYSSRLNAADSKVMGPAMSLHVMPGDEVNMTVWAKYTQAANSTNPVTGMAAIVAASAGVGGVTEAAHVTAGLNDILGAGQAAAFSGDNTIPKAYINYLFFDKNRQYKSGGFEQVGTASLNNLDDLNLSFSPTEEGYMIIYVANQTDEDIDVYFDDLTIEHIEGPIIQTDDYYPFGLTFNSSERSGFTTNNFLFNNGSEWEDPLEIYMTPTRMYDPAIGRFYGLDNLSDMFPSLSPMVYSYNNPITFFDPLGLNGIPGCDECDENATVLDEVVVTAKKTTNYATLIMSFNPIERAIAVAYRDNDINRIQQYQTNNRIHFSYGTYLKEKSREGAGDAWAKIATYGIGGTMISMFAAPVLTEAAASIGTRGAVSAAFDLSTQVGGNMIANGGNFNAALSDVNLTSVGISAINPTASFKNILINSALSASFESKMNGGFNTVFNGKSLGDVGLSVGLSVGTYGVFKGVGRIGQAGLINSRIRMDSFLNAGFSVESSAIRTTSYIVGASYLFRTTGSAAGVGATISNNVFGN